MQQTLKEPDWVGEDALAMKREATEARLARFTRRVRVRRRPTSASRRGAYALREADGGRPVARAQTPRFAAESAMRKDRGGATRELRSTLEYKGLSDEQVRSGDEYRAGRRRRHVGLPRAQRDAAARPVAPAAAAPASTADLQAPQTEVCGRRTAYGTLDGRYQEGRASPDDDSTRRTLK